MADEAKVAAGEQDNKTQTVTEAETKVEAKAETKVEKEETVGEILSPKKEPKMVPEATLIEMKKENKAMAKQMKELQKQIEEGASKKEISKSLKEIGEKHNVDPEFLQEFASAVKQEAEAEAEAKFEAKLKPLEEKNNASEIDQKFTSVFEKALDEMPEFKGIAKRETVKALALLPENANKSFKKILEENFGHLVEGKKTLQSTTPRGGAKSTDIDYNRAAKDTAYYQEIMSDPAAKAEYNKGLAKRLRL